MEPIKAWQELIKSAADVTELLSRLKEIYRDNRPYNAEVVPNSYCPNKCQHCIYPPDYHLFYKSLAPNKWNTVFEMLYNKHSFRNYIFNGRSINKSYLRILSLIKERFPDITMGIVIDGNTEEYDIAELARISPDWVDVSLDGLEVQHDIQRSQKGSFEKTLKVLSKLKGSGSFQKISILTCLTAINIESVMGMITLLNNEGLPNFFITPVSILEGYRPAPNLRPSREQLISFIDQLMERAGTLSDTWLEINIFEASYARDIAQRRPEIFSESNVEYDRFEFVDYVGTNEVHICYYPSSLTGVREFIINSNGDILPHKVAAMGKIPTNLIFGNIFHMDGGPEMFNQMIESSAFLFYLKELQEEVKLLKDIEVMIQKHSGKN